MIKEFTYEPHGTCSSLMTIKVDEDTNKIVDFAVKGGCPGNLAGIRKLIIGMDAKEVADKLSGVRPPPARISCPRLWKPIYPVSKT